jgi:hypothetical protein
MPIAAVIPEYVLHNAITLKQREKRDENDEETDHPCDC